MSVRRRLERAVNLFAALAVLGGLLAHQFANLDLLKPLYIVSALAAFAALHMAGQALATAIERRNPPQMLPIVARADRPEILPAASSEDNPTCDCGASRSTALQSGSPFTASVTSGDGGPALQHRLVSPTPVVRHNRR